MCVYMYRNHTTCIHWDVELVVQSFDSTASWFRFILQHIDSRSKVQLSRSVQNIQSKQRITEIFCSYNCLTEITPQIGLLASLKEFHCSNNEIGIACLLASLEFFFFFSFYRNAKKNCLPNWVDWRTWIFSFARTIVSRRCLQNWPTWLRWLVSMWPRTTFGISFFICKSYFRFDLIIITCVRLLPPEIGEIESLKKIDLSLNPVIGKQHNCSFFCFGDRLMVRADEIDNAARQGAPALIKYLRSGDYRSIYSKNKDK